MDPGYPSFWAEFGKPIPGSRLLRSFCPRCRAPIRVCASVIDRGEAPMCEKCDPHLPPPRPATMNEDSDQWQSNVIRELEGD